MARSPRQRTSTSRRCATTSDAVFWPSPSGAPEGTGCTHPRQSRCRAKLVEVDERVNDLLAIRDNLTTALDAGCDDLLACASAECCPIPFEVITIHPHSTQSASAIDAADGSR